MVRYAWGSTTDGGSVASGEHRRHHRLEDVVSGSSNRKYTAWSSSPLRQIRWNQVISRPDQQPSQSTHRQIRHQGPRRRQPTQNTPPLVPPGGHTTVADCRDNARPRARQQGPRGGRKPRPTDHNGARRARADGDHGEAELRDVPQRHWAHWSR